MAASRYYSSWILNYCTLFEGSLVAFAVGSTFLNRAHFDLFYQWVALIVCFGVIAKREMTGEATQVTAVPATNERGRMTRIGADGFGSRPRLRGFRPAMSRDR